MKKMHTLNGLTWLVFIAFISGCAVMRIDVDVYKGPLANNEQVQMRQFADTVIGAKPLITDLRNTYEFSEIEAMPDIEKEYEEAIKDNRGYIKDYPFNSERAWRVNEILGLYEDLSYHEDPYINWLITKARRNLSLYQDVSNRQKRNDNKELAKTEIDKAREAIAEIWEAFVLILKYIHDPEYENAPDQALVYALASAIGELTQPELLHRTVFSTQGKIKNFNFEQYSTSESFGGFRNFDSLATEWKQPDFENGSKIVQQSVLENPLGTAETLLDLNRRIKAAYPDDSRLRNYGLVRGPGLLEIDREKNPNKPNRGEETENTESKPEESGPDNLPVLNGPTLPSNIEESNTRPLFPISVQECENVYRAVKNAAGGLSDGRHLVGLNSLISEYKNDLYEGKNSEESGRRLRSALIGFAEKILTLGNNDILLGDTSSEPKGVSSFKNPRKKRQFMTVKDDQKLDRYVLFLQALGNSIMVTANDLELRGKFEERLKIRGSVDEEILTAALSQSSLDVMEAIINSLRKDLGVAETTLSAEATNKKSAGEKLENAQAEKTSAESKYNEAKTAFDSAKGALDNFQHRLFIHAYRTLTGTSKTVSELVEGKVDASDILIDSKNIANSLSQDDSSTTAEQVFVSLMAWFNTAIQKSFDGSQRHGRLTKAKSYIETNKDLFTSIDDAKPSEILNRWNELMEELLTNYESALGHLEDAYQKGKDDFDSAKNEKDKRIEEYDNAKKSFDEIETAFKGAESERSQKAAIFKNVLSEKLRVLEKAADPDAVRSLLIEQIDKRIQAARSSGADESQKTGLDNLLRTKAALEIIHQPMTITSSRASEWKSKLKNQNQRDVLDNFISLLRYRLLIAEESGDPQAEEISEALETALTHRSGLTYIRPASAYLRSSYAATGLQGNNSVEWENMLAHHRNRNILFVSEVIENDENERLEILQEIDRQYWQNINSVRVAGAGKTMYSIAKDDVGNWYVKSYEADPKPIIRAAQGLALFQAGKGINVNLLRKAEYQRKIDANEDLSEDQRAEWERLKNESPNGPNSGLEKVFSSYESAYFNATHEHASSLRKSIAVGSENENPLLTQIESSLNKKISGEGAESAIGKLKVIWATGSPVIDVLRKAELRFEGISDSNPAERDDRKALAEKHSKAIIAALKDLRGLPNIIIPEIRALNLSNDPENTALRIQQLEEAKKTAAEELEVARQLESTDVNKLKSSLNKLADVEADLASAKVDFELGQRRKEIAISVVIEVITRKILEIGDGRKKAINEFERSAMLVGDASSRSNEPSD